MEKARRHGCANCNGEQRHDDLINIKLACRGTSQTWGANHSVGQLNQGLTWSRLKGTEPLRYAYRCGKVYLSECGKCARTKTRFAC